MLSLIFHASYTLCTHSDTHHCCTLKIPWNFVKKKICIFSEFFHVRHIKTLAWSVIRSKITLVGPCEAGVRMCTYWQSHYRLIGYFGWAAHSGNMRKSFLPCRRRRNKLWTSLKYVSIGINWAPLHRENHGVAVGTNGEVFGARTPSSSASWSIWDTCTFKSWTVCTMHIFHHVNENVCMYVDVKKLGGSNMCSYSKVQMDL